MKPTYLLLAAALTACAATPVQSKLAPVSYTCTGSYTSLQVAYNNTNPQRAAAIVYTPTATYPMHLARSGSGARYTNSTVSNTLVAGDLIWWSKGNAATLATYTPSHNEKPLAVCNTSSPAAPTR